MKPQELEHHTKTRNSEGKKKEIKTRGPSQTQEDNEWFLEPSSQPREFNTVDAEQIPVFLMASIVNRTL